MSKRIEKVFSNNKKKSVIKYRKNVDTVYKDLQMIIDTINDEDKLDGTEKLINKLLVAVIKETKDEAISKMKEVEKIFNKLKFY